MRNGINNISRIRRGVMALLACVVLFISILAPFYTAKETKPSANSFLEQMATIKNIAIQDSIDLEDDEYALTDDDTDFSSDAQIHHHEFLSIGQILLTYPRLKDQIHLNHIGELMVPPPQYLS